MRAPRFGEIKQVARGQTVSERQSQIPDTGRLAIRCVRSTDKTGHSIRQGARQKEEQNKTPEY